jgi:hypothetical protein
VERQEDQQLMLLFAILWKKALSAELEAQVLV